MLERQDLTEEEKLKVLFSNLKNEEKELAEAWLKSGKSLEEIVQLLSDSRRTERGLNCWLSPTVTVRRSFIIPSW